MTRPDTLDPTRDPPMLVALVDPAGEWFRQLRGRLGRPPRPWEPRRRFRLARAHPDQSGTDFVAAIQQVRGRFDPIPPVLVLDAGLDPVKALETLESWNAPNAADALDQTAPGPCVLLDPRQRPGLADLARELGATWVGVGFVAPERVAQLIRFWATRASSMDRTIPLEHSRESDLGGFDPPDLDPSLACALDWPPH